MNILVTGAAGYIGSHTVRELVADGQNVIALDNLSHGHRVSVHQSAIFVQGSTSDAKLLRETLTHHKIEAVMHFAADIEVGESVINPSKYYRNNFSNAIELLDAMNECGVKKLVFSSTAAVYGNPMRTPIEESDLRAPINPYGRSKMMTEMAIEDHGLAHGLGFAILRYFNVVGASPDTSIGEDHRPESHLLPRLLMALHSGSAEAQIFGTDYPTPDGTCVRDYVHVVDLALAHILALKKIVPAQGQIFNLGSENGSSVRDVIGAVEKVTGSRMNVIIQERRAGDPAILVASSRKIREALGWERRYPDLKTAVEHAWAWHRSHPEGYGTGSNNS